ncbi:hypothetical protein HY251_10585, partial [bacterium]|nr:hypothetical protein [bacterium]
MTEDEVHWDLMVERASGEKLATWKLEAPLPGRKDESVSGAPSFDHRSIYLGYEGEISGGRGRVPIGARGEAETVEGVLVCPRWVVWLGDAAFSLEREGVRV